MGYFRGRLQSRQPKGNQYPVSSKWEFTVSDALQISVDSFIDAFDCAANNVNVGGFRSLHQSHRRSKTLRSLSDFIVDSSNNMIKQWSLVPWMLSSILWRPEIAVILIRVFDCSRLTAWRIKSAESQSQATGGSQLQPITCQPAGRASVMLCWRYLPALLVKLCIMKLSREMAPARKEHFGGPNIRCT